MKRIITALLAFIFVFSSFTNVMAEYKKTPIVGIPTTTVEQMQEWARLREADPDFIKEAKTFYDISIKYGIDPAVTYAQSAKETNFFKFTGVVPKDFNNPCGLKIKKGGSNEDKNAHMKFKDWNEGITAQVHHLALYAGHPDFPYSEKNTPDPRHFSTIYGKAKFVEDLGGRWAPSKRYGWDTAIMMYNLCTTKVDGVDPIPGPYIEPEIPKELIDPPKPEPPKEEPIKDDKFEPVNPDKKIQRIFGDNRITTAIKSSNLLTDKADEVIIAPAQDFADALVASSLVLKDNKYLIPILLNSGNGLNKEVKEEIIRLGAKKAIIVGGEKHIPKNVENDLVKIKDFKIERIAGTNRYETANLISEKSGNKDKYILANGRVFADALAISSYAAINDMSILLTDGKNIDSNTYSKLKNAKEIIIVGGTNSVAGILGDQLRGEGVLVSRISGNNRYQTAIEIAKKLYPKNKVYLVANGADFPDSLVGSPLGAKYGAPILLSESKGLNDSVNAYLRGVSAKNIIVLGGNNSMSTSVYRSLNSIVN